MSLTIGLTDLWSDVLFSFSYRETENYSFSDITALAKDAALGPIRGSWK